MAAGVADHCCHGYNKKHAVKLVEWSVWLGLGAKSTWLGLGKDFALG